MSHPTTGLKTRIPGSVTVWRTSDGGVTWAWVKVGLEKPSDYDGYNPFLGFFDTDRGWLLAGFWSSLQFDRGGLLYVTADGGQTWSYRGEVPAASDGRIEFTSPEAGWVLDEHGTALYRTTNGGATWREVKLSLPPEASMNLPAFFDPSHGVIELFVRTRGHPTVQFLLTNDGGATWSPGPTFFTREFRGLENGPIFTTVDATHWALATGRNLFLTGDFGTSWTTVAPEGGLDLSLVGTLQFISPELGWAVSSNCDNGCHGLLYETADGGRTWTIRLTGT